MTRGYRIRWPLGEAIARVLRDLPATWRRKGMDGEIKFCRSDMWFISCIFTLIIGGGVGSAVSAVISTSGHANDITVWQHGHFYPAFWIYLIGLLPVLMCASIEMLILGGYVWRGMRTLGSMALPRIEREPIDRTLIEKYEKGELE